MIRSNKPGRNKQQRDAALLLLLAAGMFGFAFALVPLYDVFCELTGLNGRIASQAADVAPVQQVSDREVTIQFLARVDKGMPWEFRPTETQLRVRLGEMNTTQFYARNRAAQTVSAQAVPSVAPGFAAPHLRKTECFCFTRQQLEAGAEMEMPVQFYVDIDLPAEVHTLSLSYTLYRVDPEPAPSRTAAAPL